MEVNFTVAKEDLLNFHMKHITKTKNFKHAMNYNTVFMVLLIIVIIIICKYTYYTIAIFITWLVCFLFRKKYVLYRLRKKLNNIYSFEKYTDFFQPTKLIINEDGLNAITDLAENTYKWVSIKDLYLIDNFLWIRTSTKNDIFIPTKSFKSFEIENFFINSIVKNTSLQLKDTYPIDSK